MISCFYCRWNQKISPFSFCIYLLYSSVTGSLWPNIYRLIWPPEKFLMWNLWKMTLCISNIVLIIWYISFQRETITEKNYYIKGVWVSCAWKHFRSTSSLTSQCRVFFYFKLLEVTIKILHTCNLNRLYRYTLYSLLGRFIFFLMFQPYHGIVITLCLPKLTYFHTVTHVFYYSGYLEYW